MSEENVEVVRRAREAWNEEGPSSILRFWADDGELRDPPNLPDSRVVRGKGAIAAYLADQVRVTGAMKQTAVDQRALASTVVVRLKLTIHGSESGVDVPGEMAQVIDVTDGKIQRMRLFMTWEEALEAAGLSE